MGRYSRQELFAPVGSAGQQKLVQARVAIVGCGATGAATAMLLARSGVGYLRILDRDFVEESNLQRQVLFDEADARASLPKADAARRKLSAINGDVHVEAHVTDLVPSNAADLLGSVDLVLDATDNYETRYLINDFAVREGVPWIYAGAVGSYAAGLNVLPGDTACLACLFPLPPAGVVETCETAGILNSAAVMASATQATEALKFLTGNRAALRRTYLAVDVWRNTRSEVAASKPVAGCEVCGKRNFRYLAGKNRPHITLCGRNSVQIHEHARPVDLPALAARLKPLGEVRQNGLLVRFSTNGHVLSVFPDGRAIIQGTTDLGIARSLYARYVGS